METPEIIYLAKDAEDSSYIIWQTDQPADSEDGVEYIRADLVDAVLTSAMHSDGEDRCPECGEAEPVLHCENCGHNFNRR